MPPTLLAASSSDEERTCPPGTECARIMMTFSEERLRQLSPLHRAMRAGGFLPDSVPKEQISHEEQSEASSWGEYDEEEARRTGWGGWPREAFLRAEDPSSEDEEVSAGRAPPSSSWKEVAFGARGPARRDVRGLPRKSLSEVGGGPPPEVEELIIS